MCECGCDHLDFEGAPVGSHHGDGSSPDLSYISPLICDGCGGYCQQEEAPTQD